MNRAERIDRAEEAAQIAYDDAYERIADEMIAEAVDCGAARNWRPDGAEVHRRVLAELKRNKQNEG